MLSILHSIRPLIIFFLLLICYSATGQNNDTFFEKERHSISGYDTSMVRGIFSHGMNYSKIRNPESLPNGKYSIRFGTSLLNTNTFFQIRNGGYCGVKVHFDFPYLSSGFLGLNRKLIIKINEIEYYEPCECIFNSRAKLIKKVTKPEVVELTIGNRLRRSQFESIDLDRIHGWNKVFDKKPCE